MKVRILGLLAALLAAGSANALVINDDHDLGYIEYGIPSGDAERTAYVNHLIDMDLNSSDTALGQNFTRSGADFGPYADAVWALNGNTTTISLGTTDYQYLMAKYDGPNYGSIVWYIGDLSDTITIPGFASQYGLSGWTLFTGTGTTTNAPEPGTLALFGLGLVTLATARRRKKA